MGRRRNSFSTPLLFVRKVVNCLNILAIDQARSGAWSVFDYDTKCLVGYGYFSFDSKKYTYAKAIQHIEELVESIILSYDISAVFIEDIQLRANVQAFKKLAQLQGVLVNLFEKNEYLYDYIAPSQWQNYCKARSRNSTEIKKNVLSVDTEGKKESKMLSIQFVKDQFGIETENDNIADALCIGYFVSNTMTIERSNKRTKK